MALDHEQEVFGHASQPLFWLLTISILAFWGFSAVHPPLPSALPRQRFSKSHFPIRFTSRIQPYITTHTNQDLFIALYIAILALELLQGRRILHTSLCFGEVFFERFPVYEEVELWVYVVFFECGRCSVLLCCYSCSPCARDSLYACLGYRGVDVWDYSDLGQCAGKDVD